MKILILFIFYTPFVISSICSNKYLELLITSSSISNFKLPFVMIVIPTRRNMGGYFLFYCYTLQILGIHLHPALQLLIYDENRIT